MSISECVPGNAHDHKSALNKTEKSFSQIIFVLFCPSSHILRCFLRVFPRNLTKPSGLIYFKEHYMTHLSSHMQLM